LRQYNYSYIRDLLETNYHQRVSLATVIDRAKKHGFYLKKRPKKAPHDREVLTNYVGEIIQHDASYTICGRPLPRRSGTLSPPSMTLASSFSTLPF
jgi:hypothetical protein